jgi:hypothetical protein
VKDKVENKIQFWFFQKQKSKIPLIRLRAREKKLILNANETSKQRNEASKKKNATMQICTFTPDKENQEFTLQILGSLFACMT